MIRWLKRTLLRVLIAVLALYAIWIGGFGYLRFANPPITMVRVQHAVETVLEQRRPRQRQQWVPLAELPPHVPRAVVAAEDSRFFQHRGFDIAEVRAAREQAARRGTPPRGASTITQQLIKNLYFTTHRSRLRKGLELSLTPFAELILGKDRILELYVNVVEFGPGVYGIAAAAQHHYEVPPQQLTRNQAARLAAVLPAPRTRQPQRMGAYAATIQQRMRAMGW